MTTLPMPQAATTPAPAQAGTPAAPADAPAAQVSVTPASAPLAGVPAPEVYQAYRAQLRVLRDQLETLDDSRRELVGRLREGTVSDADRAGIDQRLTQVDQQIAAKQIAIAEAEARVAQAAAVPGATREPPRPPERLSASDVAEMSAVIFTILAIPLVLAWARRIWRKSSVTINLPPELTDRLTSMERSIDTVAMEVERIGEGQRFVTQLMNERTKAPQLPQR
jgi:hypothetical protein